MSRKLFYIWVLSLSSCVSADKPSTPDNLYFVESKLSFYDPNNEGFFVNEWVRKPSNIRMLHETFKKYGYTSIFSDYDLTSNPCMIWSYIKKSCANIIDSLILTYPQKEIAQKYYREFWLRRKKEQNDTVVFSVLKEIRSELIDKKRVGFNDKLTNDTIFNLIRINNQMQVDDITAERNFEYLRGIGLNLSAYNLLFEWTPYENLMWNKEELKLKLRMDTVPCCAHPIITDTSK